MSVEELLQSIQKDVAAIQESLKTPNNDVKDLQTKIKTDIDATVNAVGLPVGYLALASVILNIILFIAVIVIAVKSLSKKDIENVESVVKSELRNFQNSNPNTANQISRADFSKLSSSVDRLGEDLRVFKTEITNLLKQQHSAINQKKNDEPSKPSILIAHGYSSRPAPKSIAERCKPEYENFIREFNAFQNKRATISDPRDKRNEETMFKEKHKIRTLKCSNVSARMREPVPDPVFADDSQDAIFWAYKLPLGYYAVVPFVKNYNNNTHGEQAMGDVFKSNFKSGEMYKKVAVITPAILDLKLNLVAQGELVLSDG